MKYAIMLSLIMGMFALSARTELTREERLLRFDLLVLCTPEDYISDEDAELPDVPLRKRDSLLEFTDFFEKSGWTTNQFIGGLMFFVTNYLDAASWSNEDNRVVAGRALDRLGNINDPSVTNFLRTVIDRPDMREMRRWAITPMFQYTNLEPEVLAYLRTLCVRTNIYSSVTTQVIWNMLETLETMPKEFKISATNRVAQYLYFSVLHTPRGMASQDCILNELIPVYSNSIQRLEAMRYIANTATNPLERVNANEAIRELTSIPTNRLNDLKWLAE